MPKGVRGRATCEVEWCTKPVHGRGLCSTHYRQVRSRGDIAEWSQQGDHRVRPCMSCGASVQSESGLRRVCDTCRKQRAAAKAARLFQQDPEKVRRRQRESAARRRQDPVASVHKREVNRNRRLVRDYGMTRSEYDALLEQQLGFCAICHRAPRNGGLLVVDHNHATGDVRGLLCHPCNTAIGLFRDMPAWCRSAASYLESRGGAVVSYLDMKVVS